MDFKSLAGVRNLNPAGYRALSVCLVEPFPEAGRDVKGVVAVLCLDEDVGVYEVFHASPALSASL